MKSKRQFCLSCKYYREPKYSYETQTNGNLIHQRLLKRSGCNKTIVLGVFPHQENLCFEYKRSWWRAIWNRGTLNYNNLG